MAVKMSAQFKLREIVRAAKCDRCGTKESTVHKTVKTRTGTYRRVCRCVRCI